MESIKQSIVAQRVHVEAVLLHLGSWLQPIPFPIVGAALVGFATIFVWHAFAWAVSPLRKFPGPFLAGWSNLWRLKLALSGRYTIKMLELHKKYGPVIRIGPNNLSLDYPELARTIYGTDNKFIKSDKYKIASAKVNGKLQFTVFSETDPVEAAHKKRPIVKYYTPSMTASFEPHMDRTLGKFCKILDERFVKTQTEFDFARWVMYLTWDMMGDMVFSRPFGYLDQACDFDGTIALSASVNGYWEIVGQMPSLDAWLDKNPLIKLGPQPFVGFGKMAVERIAARVNGTDSNYYHPDKPDYLQFFLESKEAYPNWVNDQTVMTYVTIHINAGADTSAFTISSILYLALKHPAVFTKMVTEIRNANFDMEQSVPYAECRQQLLPYFDAVCREGLRLQPILGMPMERIVPAEGLPLPDNPALVIPGGTAVGINMWISGQNQALYGEDAAQFRPERWLRAAGESEADFSERMKRYAAADIGFGGGSRICLGKNLGLMETCKTLATLVNRYDVELAEPEKEWELFGTWLRKPRELKIKLKLREE